MAEPVDQTPPIFERIGPGRKREDFDDAYREHLANLPKKRKKKSDK